MNKLFVSNLVSLDGFIAGTNGELDWFRADDEFLSYAREMVQSIGGILFGRRTYEMMAAHWPTERGKQGDPIIAERMNNLPKFVVSKTRSDLEWTNSQLVRDPVAENVRKLKETASGDIAILGSGELVSSLFPHGLIDELRLLVHPVILGRGQPEFSAITERVELTLSSARPFKSGVVMLIYELRK
jgi:dihydrofolate reductase